LTMDNLRNLNNQDFFELETLREKILFVLRYAILAPSTHNSQPWLFKVGERNCLLYADSRIKIKEADPVGRDLYISLGCCLANLTIAAKYFGIFDSVKYFPSETDAVAEIEFLDSGAGDHSLEQFVDAIPARTNARGRFNKRGAESDVFERLAMLKFPDGLQANYIIDTASIQELARLTGEGIKVAYRSAAFRREMSAWMHSNTSGKKDGLLGYSLRMPLLLSFIIPTLVRHFNIGGLLAKLNVKSLGSAPFVAVISASKDSKLLWVQTGELAERIMLELTARGLKTSIFAAAIEMGSFAGDIQKLLNLNLTPQFLFAGGYMSYEMKKSPRHPLQEKLI